MSLQHYNGRTLTVAAIVVAAVVMFVVIFVVRLP